MGDPLQINIYRARVTQFLRCFKQSKNHHVQYIGAKARICTMGTLGRYWVWCAMPDSIAPLDVDLVARAKDIADLLDVRDGVLELAGVEQDDVAMILNELCCE